MYEADGYYIRECSEENRDKYVHIDDLCIITELLTILKVLLTMGC